MVRDFKCIHCGNCVVCRQGARDAAGNWNPALCKDCGLCAEVCPTGASILCGEYLTPEQVLERILPDRPFFRDTGGVTISGGEPMMQPEFSIALAKLLKTNGLHTVLETSGFTARENLLGIAPSIDIFFYDWKETDPEKHRKFTGQDNFLIRENLDLLYFAGYKIVLRCPLIPGYNDTREHLNGIADLTRKYPDLLYVEVLPYQPLGNSKRTQLGIAGDGIAVPEKSTVKEWVDYLRSSCGIGVKFNNSFRS